MAIGTPVDQGHAASASTPASLAITTLANISAHDTIILWHFINSNASPITSIVDSAGNTWTKAVIGQTAFVIEMWYCIDSLVMNSGSTITTNWTTSSLRHAISAFSLTGLTKGGAPGSLDVNNSPVAVSTTATSTTTTSTPVGSNIQLLTSCFGSASAPGTFTQGGSWSAVGGTTTTVVILPFYQIVASTASVNFAPSWVNSTSFVVCTRSFKGVPATNTSRQAQASLVGVGA